MVHSHCTGCGAALDALDEHCPYCGDPAPVTAAPQSAGPEGLGGWLVLVALGFTLTPFIVLGGMSIDLFPIITEGYWPLLTDPSSESYHRLWAPLLIYEFVGNSLQIVVALTALALFFRKSALFPKVAIAFYLGVWVFVATDLYFANLIPAVAEQDDSQSVAQVARQTVACCIWVPYMLRSRRVKNTFTR